MPNTHEAKLPTKTKTSEEPEKEPMSEEKPQNSMETTETQSKNHPTQSLLNQANKELNEARSKMKNPNTTGPKDQETTKSTMKQLLPVAVMKTTRNSNKYDVTYVFFK